MLLFGCCIIIFLSLSNFSNHDEVRIVDERLNLNGGKKYYYKYDNKSLDKIKFNIESTSGNDNGKVVHIKFKFNNAETKNIFEAGSHYETETIYIYDGENYHPIVTTHEVMNSNEYEYNIDKEYIIIELQSEYDLQVDITFDVFLNRTE